MIKDRENSYTEILEIFKYMDPMYIEKIPKELIEFFEKNKSQDYVFKYNINLTLDKQTLSDNTLALLAMLNLNYWCEAEEKKEQLRKLYADNEKKYQAIMQIPFNPEDVFKKDKQEGTKQYNKSRDKNETELAKYKESPLKKLINRIKSILHIK